MGVSELGHEFHDILQSGASYGEYVSHAAARSPSLSALSTFLRNKTLQPSSASKILSMQVDLRGQAGDYRVTGLEEVMAQVEDLQYQARKGFGGGLLIAVEDPGPNELEALGEALDVDPFFFAGHLAMTFQHIERNPNPPLLSLLPSKLASAEHININFQTVLDLGDEDDTVMCPRPYKVTIAGNNMRQLRILPPLSRRCIGLVRSCASVLRKDIGNSAWICLVMTDPAFKVANGASRGCSENPMLRRGISAEDVARQPTYSSFRKSSDRSFRLRSGSLAENLFSVWRDVQMPLDPVNGIPGILDLAYYPIRMALTEWKLYVQLMSRYVKFFEYSFETVMALPDRFERQDLVELNRWRRRGGQSLHKIRMTRNFVEYWRGRACGSSAIAQQQREDWGLLLLDLKHIEMQIEKNANALESLNPIITSLVQLMNSHRSVSEASDVRRLTYIAIVFIPLSFIATLFSMGDDFLPGKTNFWLYWVTSIPITLLVLAATSVKLLKTCLLFLPRAFYGRALKREKVRERDKESVCSG